MPKVPQAKIGTVQTRALPGVRSNVGFSPEQFGAGQARALRQGGSDLLKGMGQVAKAIEKEKVKANKSRIEIQANEHQARTNDLIREFRSVKGTQANEQKDDFNKRYKKLEAEASKDLTPEQAELFSVEASRIKLNWENHSGNHAMEQHQAVARQGYKSSVKNTTENAAFAYMDDREMLAELARQGSAVDNLAELEGM